MLQETYLLPDTKEQLRLAWQSDGFVQIDHLLSVEDYIRLAKCAWGKGKQVERPDQYSYSLVPSAPLHTAFSGSVMSGWLGSLLGGKVRVKDISVRHFRHGDYTLLHDTQRSVGVAQFFFIFSGMWDPAWGGGLTVHRDQASPLQVSLKGNRFFLVRSRAEWKPFVHYVNHLAGKETFVIVQGTVS
jgi:hypothetical protein